MARARNLLSPCTFRHFSCIMSPYLIVSHDRTTISHGKGHQEHVCTVEILRKAWTLIQRSVRSQRRLACSEKGRSDQRTGSGVPTTTPMGRPANRRAGPPPPWRSGCPARREGDSGRDRCENALQVTRITLAANPRALARIMHETPSRDRGDGRATGQPSRGTAGLDLRRTCSVRRKVRDPRTPGRTAISAVAAGGSCIMRARVQGFFGEALPRNPMRSLGPPFFASEIREE